MPKIRKVINDPERVVVEVLEGICALAGGELVLLPEARVLHRAQLREDKVALVVGGGAGHEPMYGAFVGPGLADASVSGEIFAAPAPERIVAAARAVHRGRGVLFVYGNYAGDNLNFDMAAELLAEEGIETRTVRVADDVASADPAARRGIAGAVYQVKVAGYACEQLPTLEQAAALVERAKENIRSFGVALAAGSLPHTGEPTFELGADEIEIGMGVHGERGVERRPWMPADELVDFMTARLLADLPHRRGDRLAVLVNNLGSTTFGELMIVYRRLRRLLDQRGLVVARSDVGPYFTSQEMAGFSITLMRLDEELERALAFPARSPGFVEPARS